MKVYHYKHHDIIMNQTAPDEVNRVDEYHSLTAEILRVKTISESGIYQAINLCNGSILATPFNVASLMKRKVLPAFRFLSCNN